MSIFADYPAPPGNKRFSIAQIYGPSSYTQVSAASPPTGGDVHYANEFGLKEIEFAVAIGGDGGLYGVQVIIDSTYASRAAPTIRLMWVTLATGVEASAQADLDAVKVRILAIGT